MNKIEKGTVCYYCGKANPQLLNDEGKFCDKQCYTQWKERMSALKICGDFFQCPTCGYIVPRTFYFAPKTLLDPLLSKIHVSFFCPNCGVEITIVGFNGIHDRIEGGR